MDGDVRVRWHFVARNGTGKFFFVDEATTVMVLKSQYGVLTRTRTYNYCISSGGKKNLREGVGYLASRSYLYLYRTGM